MTTSWERLRTGNEFLILCFNTEFLTKPWRTDDTERRTSGNGLCKKKYCSVFAKKHNAGTQPTARMSIEPGGVVYHVCICGMNSSLVSEMPNCDRIPYTNKAYFDVVILGVDHTTSDVCSEHAILDSDRFVLASVCGPMWHSKILNDGHINSEPINKRSSLLE